MRYADILHEMIAVISIIRDYVVTPYTLYIVYHTNSHPVAAPPPHSSLEIRAHPQGFTFLELMLPLISVGDLVDINQGKQLQATGFPFSEIYQTFQSF